jgi:hypothetical protein
MATTTKAKTQAKATKQQATATKTQAKATAKQAERTAEQAERTVVSALSSTGYAVLGVGDAAVDLVRTIGKRSAKLPAVLLETPDALSSFAEQTKTTVLDALTDLVRRGRTVTGQIAEDPAVQEAADKASKTARQAKVTTGQAKAAATKTPKAAATQAKRAVTGAKDAAKTTAKTATTQAKKAAEGVVDAAAETADTAASQTGRATRIAQDAAKSTASTADRQAEQTAGQAKELADEVAATTADVLAGRPARYDSSAAGDRVWLELIGRAAGGHDPLVATVRQAGLELVLLARRLDEARARTPVPTRIVDGEVVRVDAPLPWVATLTAHAEVHLPERIAALRALR